MNEPNHWLFRYGYWRLSHRGRFYMDLAMIPVAGLLLAATVRWLHRPESLVAYWPVAVVAVVGVVTAAYNYRCWRSEASASDHSEAAKV